MPEIGKEFIKEGLWETSDPGIGNRQWSRQLGGAARENLWTWAGREAEPIVDERLCRIGYEVGLASAFLRHCGLKL
jgi:hypothetical protein